MYKKVPTTLNFVEREKETLKFWKDNQIFEKSVQLRQGAPAYTFFDRQRQAPHRPCTDPCHEGYNPPLQDHAGLRRVA